MFILGLLTSATAVAAGNLMCGSTSVVSVNASSLHYHQEGLAVFPCQSGPKTAPVIGSLSTVYLVHHQPHISDPANMLDLWLKQLSNTTGITVGIASGDTVAVSGERSALEALSSSAAFNQKVIQLAPRPIAARNPAMTAKLLAKRKSLRGADPVIQGLVNRVTAESALDNLNYLTGVTSDLKSRNSIHPDGLKAAQWLKEQFTRFGFSTELEPFGTDNYNPNVIATLRGSSEPDTIVVIGAHYDSRGVTRSSATADAPGANDDGSGTSLLLQLARLINDDGTSFKYTLVIGAWSGEEQGLVGSRAYAAKCKNRGDNILAMLQADMIVYRKPGEGIQNGYPNRYADPILIDLVTDVMAMYTPEVESCETTVCCSDHQSFTENGYSATQFFERCGSIADPMYHNAGDIIKREGYDVSGQLLSLSKACVAAAATLLEPV